MLAHRVATSLRHTELYCKILSTIQTNYANTWCLAISRELDIPTIYRDGYDAIKRLVMVISHTSIIWQACQNNIDLRFLLLCDSKTIELADPDAIQELDAVVTYARSHL